MWHNDPCAEPSVKPQERGSFIKGAEISHGVLQNVGAGTVIWIHLV